MDTYAADSFRSVPRKLPDPCESRGVADGVGRLYVDCYRYVGELVTGRPVQRVSDIAALLERIVTATVGNASGYRLRPVA